MADIDQRLNSKPDEDRRETLLGSRTLPLQGEGAHEDKPSDAENLGRGQRLIKPTTIMIDGQAVKRQNMYDMEEGEGSVWDRELGAPIAGFEARARSVHVPAEKKVADPKQAPKPRTVTAEERIRQSRNEQLKLAEAKATAARAVYLAPYADLLGRFGARTQKPSAGAVSATRKLIGTSTVQAT
jgi:hypothetical protein